MSARLEGRVIVVTGASGIAAASAERLGSEGARVFTVSRTGAHCVELSDHLSSMGIVHAWAEADLRDERSTVGAFDAAIDTFGRLDGVLCVAGGSGRRMGDGPLDAVTLDGWNATLALNLTTTFLSMREGVRRMLGQGGGGAITVVSSVLASSPSPNLFGTHAYAVAKGGQLALVHAAAAAYAPDGIRVNAITPAVVVTPMSVRAQDDEVVTAYVERKQPLAAGFLEADTVASAAAFLLSDEAAMITGQVLAVDGGWTVTEAGG